jgi:serine/threonine protein kinase
MLPAQHRLGDFEIVRLLGKGGMGEVYEAQQLNPPRRVALKVLARWLADDEDSLRRFWREAAVPARLDHPSIVRIISTGKSDDGTAYYTMQLIRGLSLADLIKDAGLQLLDTVSVPTTPYDSAQRQPPLEVYGVANPSSTALVQEYCTDRHRLVARLGIQVARALASAHAHGYLHRDIKPSNVMVDHHGHLYLLDFGLTRARNGDATVTRPGAVLGTPWYMSPEQARGEPTDHRSDLYSLGVTLYQLASGGVGPFTADKKNSEAVLAQVRAGQLVPLAQMAPGVPRSLARVIMRAADPDPWQRYQTAEELATALQAFLDDKPVPTPWRLPPSMGPVGRRILLGTAALALLALVIFGARHWRPAAEVKSDGRKTAKRAFGVELPAGEDCLPYPDILRHRPLDHAIALFSQQHQPLWHCVLCGNNGFQRFPGMLMINTKGPRQTLIALDNDPEGRPFEFSVDLNAALRGPGKERLGVFFGWRGFAKPFFVAEIDENPTKECPQGRLLVSVMQVFQGAGAEKGTKMLTGSAPDSVIPLKAKGWHRVVVRAPSHFRGNVRVDGDVVALFDVTRLEKRDPNLSGNLDSCGALGIWAENADMASFRIASITSFGDDGSN